MSVRTKHHQVWLWILLSANVAAENEPRIETMVVEGRRINLVGEALSASEGVVGQQEIELRPLARTGDILESVPGMVVTQHSGTGKANQYFLRGFNLDHGSDFATFVGEMPVNMRTHGHGQGYTDLNFLIPEAVATIAYKKGAYYADVGDFSGAGSAHMQLSHRVDEALAKLTVGKNAYYRALILGSFEAVSSDWLYALEANSYDGPWSDIQEDLQKYNLLLRKTRELSGGQLNLTFMGYDNRWNSADQIPSRAVESGLIDEFGSIDDTPGGESSRYSLSGRWQNGGLELSAYAIRYTMNLWSNFTYFLDDEDLGDEYEQVDARHVYGGQGSYLFMGELAGGPMTNRVGAQWRYDVIDEVGLYRTVARQRLGPIRSDEVDELSTGLYWENRLAWSEQFRSVVGLRYDYYSFDVDSLVAVNINEVDLRANSGTADEDLLSVKASLIYALNGEWETYASAGQGFHSSDARGTTIAVDPVDGAELNGVDPLVRSLGYEIGLRGFWNERLNTSIALWHLKLDSELLFIGDAGTTEASRESARSGLEVTAYYRMTDDWTFDAEYAYTDSDFSDSAPEGNDIPGAIKQVLQTGISAEFANGWFGSFRLRYFGKRPLTEDSSVKSAPSTLASLRAGYSSGHCTLIADVLNMFDSNDHDIDYFYESRLAGEPSGQGVEDIHYHVLEPRTFRFSVAFNY